MPTQTIPTRRSQSSRLRRGTTFTEVMFAVILLGIGFIMLAGMFPVAISQTQLTVEETIGAAIARSATHTVEQLAADPGLTFPVTGTQVVDFRSANINLWNAVRGNLVLSQDARFAWVPFYRRKANENFIQLYVIGVQSRNSSAYRAASDTYRVDIDGKPTEPSGDHPAALEPKRVSVQFGEGIGPGGSDLVTFGSPIEQINVFAPGAFLLVANEPGNLANGYVFRLGNPVPGTEDQWELAPGWDFHAIPAGVDRPVSNQDVDVYVVGRGFALPREGKPKDSYDGPAQDICFYTTFIRVAP